ncbi:MAG: MMPL family transporter [Candidatus Cohnella colombiensis]|uniref:MMPL family transporter n=1 Tax=Candidatus Cohnella colombiensis TaxID=3121368 RepID=A0AA95F5F7_9BACL|nr:MAG: MMPL family transporter [Cohnella sp.]
MLTRWLSSMFKLRWYLLAGWFILAMVCVLLLPNLSTVVSRTEQQLLPNDAQSIQATELLKKINEDADYRTNVIITYVREQGLTAIDQAWMNRLLADLKIKSDELGLLNILSSYTQPELAERFVSKDGSTTIALLYLPSSDLDDATKQTLLQLNELILNVPDGAQVHLTGSAPIAQDFQQSSQQGVQRTEFITIGLVLLILLFVFRSPIAPFIPLISIGISLTISRALIAVAADWGLPVTYFTEPFLIAVLFGAGTDYCILIMQRYREELLLDDAPVAAMQRTMHGVGKTIMYATSTVFLAFVLIGLAQFGLYQSATGTAIGVLVTLFVGMTLTPALILLMGRALFWPYSQLKLSHRKQSRLWTSAANLATKRPLAILLITVILLAPVTLLFQGKRSFDDIAQVDPNLPSVVGYKQVERAFSTGEVFPVTLVINSTDTMRTAASFLEIEKISAALAKIPGIQEVRSVTRPLGQRLTVGNGSISTSEGNPIASTKSNSTLSNLFKIAIDAIPLSEGFTGIISSIRSMKSTITPLLEELKELESDLKELDWLFGAKKGNDHSNETIRPTDPVNENVERLMRMYLSEDGHTTSIQVIMNDNPFSTEAMNRVTVMRDLLLTELDQSIISKPQVLTTGTSAKYEELSSISSTDFIRTGLLMLLGIVIILMLLLRSILVPIFVFLSLVFNYFITMGLLEFLYVHVWGADGLSWTTSFFVFLIVVALGVDYSIFLMARYREEIVTSNASAAMTKALSSTGGVILSAAVIMAGTFGALSFSGVVTLVQIGIGAVIGLLLYATLFIGLVVPAFTIVANRLNRQR